MILKVTMLTILTMMNICSLIGSELFGSNKDMQSALNLCFSIFLILLGTNISHYLIDVDSWVKSQSSNIPILNDVRVSSFHADLIWLNWVFGGKHFKLLIGCWLKLQVTVTIGLHLGVRIWLMLKSKSCKPVTEYSWSI